MNPVDWFILVLWLFVVSVIIVWLFKTFLKRKKPRCVLLVEEIHTNTCYLRDSIVSKSWTFLITGSAGNYVLREAVDDDLIKEVPMIVSDKPLIRQEVKAFFEANIPNNARIGKHRLLWNVCRKTEEGEFIIVGQQPVSFDFSVQ